MSAAADGSRFLHLLQPIRDLSQNWNIDLAQELEEYLDELEHLSIAFDPHDADADASVGVATRAKKAQADDARVMNFAEAALLIQGTSVIYSRKVEYLYALVFQTLAHLTRPQDAARVANAAADDSSHGDNSHLQAAHDSDDAFDVFAHPLPVVDELVEARNITLRAVGTDTQRQRHGGSLVKSNTNIQASISLMGSLIPDERDHGETFKLLSCTLHASGVLLLDETSKKYLTGADSGDSDAMFATATAWSDPVTTLNFDSVADDFFMDGPDNDRRDNDNDDGVDAYGDLDYGYADDDNDADDRHGDGELNDATESTGGRQVSFAAQQAATPLARAVRHHQERDPWTPLDPYDASGSTSRPFRKGRSYPKPKKSKPKTTTKKGKDGDGTNDDDDVVDALDDPRFHERFLFGASRPQWASWVWTDTTSENALERKCKSKFCKAPLLVKSCDELWKLETKWKALVRRRAAKAAQSAEAMLLQEQAAEEEEQIHALGLDMAAGVSALDMDLNAPDDENDDDENGDDDGAAFDGGDWDQGGLEDDDTYGTTSTLGRFKDNDADGGVDTSDPNAPLSYDDICRQHLQSFMSGADKYVRETNLSKQVNDWQSTLTPILKEQDLRPPFDIHTYGREILGQLAYETKVKQEGLLSQPKKRKAGDSAATDDANIPFEDLVGGRSQYEVCRMFLASLQLANSGNVQLVHGQSASEQSHVPFRMKLLSTANVYESLQSAHEPETA